MRYVQQDLLNLTTQLLTRAGAAPDEAEVVAKILVWCDEVGRSTQGLWRLAVLCDRLAAGGIRSPGAIEIRRAAPACLLVDGNDASGHFICNEATLAAISTVSDTGCVAVAINNSNYCGALGYFVCKAAKSGNVAFAWSNSFAKVAAFGGNQPVLGTNPMAFSVPVAGSEPLVVDMSTSAIAGSTARMAEQKGQTLEPGIASSASGESLNDPAKLDDGFLLPFGGAKGFALALICEVLCGALASAAFSRDVRSLYGDPAAAGKNGQFMILLDPARFLPAADFDASLRELVESLTTENGVTRLPGDARWKALRKSKKGGVELADHTVNELCDLCATFSVSVPDFLSA